MPAGMSRLSYAYKVPAGAQIDLTKFSTAAPTGLTQDDAAAMLQDLQSEFHQLQRAMYGASACAEPEPKQTSSMRYATPQPRTSDSVLIIVQGTDGAGKDSLIRTIFHGLNPLWLKCDGFKAASFDERGHDFLWRSHRVLAQPGFINAFHRSYYEGVLAERVHAEVPPHIWQRRYDQINAFEQALVDADTIVLKFFLHIDKDVQKQRLIAREQDVLDAWKLSAPDWEERQRWDDYQVAFTDMLSKTSAANAPWFIVPSDDKLFAALATADAIVSTLRPYCESWTQVLENARTDQLKAIDQVGRR